MGNSNNKQVQEQNNLIVRARLMEQQVRNCGKIDPSIRNSIGYVKQTKDYRNLILPGGGLTSLAVLGTLEYLNKHEYLNNIENIGASSFSSIIAILLAVNCPLSEIRKHIFELPWNKFLKKHKAVKCTDSDIFHVADDYGQNNGQLFHDTIAELIEKYTNNKHYTLQDVWKDYKINLVIPVTDLANKTLIYFNHETYPNVPLRIIIRAACTIPGILAPIIIDGHYLVDASLRDQCPEYLFDTEVNNLHDVRFQLGLASINPHTLAVRVMRDLPLRNQSLLSDLSTQYEHFKIRNKYDYNLSVLNLCSLVHNDKFRTPESPLRTITVHVPVYELTKTNISYDELTDLVSNAYTATQSFFNTR